MGENIYELERELEQVKRQDCWEGLNDYRMWERKVLKLKNVIKNSKPNMKTAKKKVATKATKKAIQKVAKKVTRKVSKKK